MPVCESTQGRLSSAYKRGNETVNAAMGQLILDHPEVSRVDLWLPRLIVSGQRARGCVIWRHG